jgi:hypothetical protein
VQVHLATLPLDVVDFGFDHGVARSFSVVDILVRGIVADRTEWRDISKSPVAGDASGLVGAVL